ncbi:immunoglobulin-like domain-containing protein [Listeria booriae]|uniref:immunoglobulin-like domain-containing protein n=1 Tax=Listeria booriae TaxID=1552123 RepID=UPI001625AB21|nr:immunoglobulin-like domain-containing protein [Listeria booriae]MBC2195758.1 hypothetical protein [Listeria booriae]
MYSSTAGWYHVDSRLDNYWFDVRSGGDAGSGAGVQVMVYNIYAASRNNAVLYQNVKTVPGEEYTFSFSAKRSIYGAIGINIYDNTETRISSTPMSRAADYDADYQNYSNTFTAQSNETRVEIAMVGDRISGNTYTGQGVFDLLGASITPTDTTPPDAPNVTTVYDTDTTIKGTGEANCDVKVTLPSGDVVTGRTDGSGNFSITIPAQTAGREIKVTLTDGAGNESNPTTVIVQATALAKPTIGAVTSNDTMIYGTGISGATITATIGSSTYQGTVVDGSYIIYGIPKQPAGTVIYVKQSKDGKTSESASTIVTQGTINPPMINTVTTDDTTVKGTGMNGATVTVKIGSTEYTATVTGGEYSVTIPKQPVGTEITAKQALNGVTSMDATTTVIQGTVAAPTIDAVTTDDTTVKGTGINGATVTVKIGSDEYEATVTDGKYSVTIPKQAVGTEITAKQALGGQTSSEVKTTVTQGIVAAPTIDAVTTDDTTVKGTGINGATVTVKIGSEEFTATVANNTYSITIPKQAFGTEITAKQSLGGQTSSEVKTTVTQGTVAAPTIDAVTTDDTTVKGTGINGATVTVKIGSDEYTATVANNAYSITIPKQAFGTEITAKQSLNGKTSSEVKTTVAQGTVAPPTINPVTTDDTTVKGTGINGATVKVKIGSDEYTATVTNNEYTVTVPKQASGTIITATQTLNGKTSDLETTVVGQGTVAPPTINSLTTDDTTASGTGITGAVVTITIGSQTYTTTVVNGNYSVTIPKQPVGTVVYAKQTLFGQTSSDAQTTVTQGAIAAPTINAVTTDDTTVKGTGINGATVTVKIGSDEYTATVANNTYSVTIPKQAFGTEITAKQSLGGKTSDQASTTVTQGTVANPTINAVTTDDTTVKGSGINGATVTLTIGGDEYQGTVTNGSYSITIPKQAAGTDIFAKQTLNGKTSDSVSTRVTQGTLAAPTINDYTVGDGYVTGSAPAGATKVALYVGDKLIRYADVTAGKYRVYAGDNAAMGVAGTAFQVAGVDSSGAIGAKGTSTVKPSATVAAPTIKDFYVGDVYAKGTATGASKVTLYVDGVAVRQATVNADGTYSIYTGDRAKLATAGNTFQIEASNASGKTSTKTTGTVKAKLAAPTINDFYVGDAYAKGIAAGGASKVTLYIDGVAVRQATVNADGSYSIYTGDRATLATAGNTFQIESSAPTGETSVKTTGTVKAKETVAAPTIKDFYVGDVYAKGTATGASKVTLYVDGVAVRQATVNADGTYSIYTGDRAKLATAGNTFQIEASNASGKTSTKTTGTVKAKLAAPTINDFYVGDAYAKGIAAGGASKVTLYIDGVAVRQAAVAADGSYSIYTGDRATLATAGNTFQIQSSAPTGETSVKTTGTVKAKETVAAPTIKDFYVGDAYAKGTAPGASKVTLYIDGVAVRQAAVNADGTYSIYTGDRATLATAGNTFQIQSTTASGATSVKTTGTVKARIAAPTISDYYTTDVYAKGTAPTGATKVALYVKNVLIRYATVTDGKYTIYTGDQSYLTTVGNTFQIAAVDASNNIGTKATGTVKKDDRAAYKLTANDYNIATDETVKGTAGSSITRVKIEVDGVIKRQTTVGADGSYAIYAADAILNTGNVVKVIGLDAQGVERNITPVTVKNESSTAYALTASDYNIATDETVRGTAGSSVTRVQIEVDGVVKRQTNVGTDGKYAIYAKDVILNTGNVVKIIALDAQGNKRNEAPVTVKNESSTAFNVTAGNYNIATDETVKGTVGSSITRVQIEVDGVVARQTNVGADGNYAIYAKDVILNTGNVVKIIGLDAQGNERNRATVTVKNETPVTYNMTADKYNTITDQYVTGTADAAITKVKLVVNNVDARSTTTSGGKYSIYASDKITSSSDTVQIVGYDANGTELKRITVPVVSVDPAARTITVADYKLRAASITGTFGSDIKKIQLFVDGAFARQGAITGNAFEIYAQDKVTSATQTVQVVGFDASGVELARQNVTIK